MYKLFWSSLQSFFPEQKCQTFAGSSFFVIYDWKKKKNKKKKKEKKRCIL